MATELEIFTDGACKGNPGPGGWGAILRMGPHEKELWGGEAATTNNRMELTAVIRGLEAMKRPITAKFGPIALPLCLNCAKVAELGVGILTRILR